MTMTQPAGTVEGLRVLIRVDGELDQATVDAVTPYEGDEPYFPDHVDAELPRDLEATETIVAATKGHAIADESGNIIARFEGERNGKSSIQRAVEARSGAKVVLTMDLPEDDIADDLIVDDEANDAGAAGESTGGADASAATDESAQADATQGGQ